MTATARYALREVCEPLVHEWLDSDAYNESRQGAFKWMVRNHLRNERYSADSSASVLAQYGHELAPADREDLTQAVAHLRSFLLLLG